MRIIDLTLDRKYRAILIYTYTDTYVSGVLIYMGVGKRVGTMEHIIANIISHNDI